MTTAAQTKDTIRDFILTAISLPGLDDDTNLFEAGFANSLFAVQLTTFLEKTFGITVEMEDLDIENLKSVNAAAAFVMRKSGHA